MLHASLSALATLLVSLCLTPNMVAAQTTFFPGVLATGTMGPTNPPQPTLGTAINRPAWQGCCLLIRSMYDFCLFAPPTLQNISDSETIEVAWCTQQRNNARLIPDGTISGVSFLKTDMYIQLLGFGDLTKLNIPAGDFGGELDPHGAFGSGNPIGGNVTSNITGADENFAEWMLYIDDNQFCIRVAANMCWHELDEMGCEFVMPGNYNVNGTFETCEADVAYPPGWYPTATVNGTPVFSTFAQRFTGTLAGGSVYTVGDLTTPAAPFSTPSSSSCVTTATISNGVNLAALGVTAATGSSGGLVTQTISGAVTVVPTGSASGAAQTTGTTQGSGAMGMNANSQAYPMVALWAVLSGLGAVVLFN
ncbi:hypothetical protein BDZ97DRAFT_1905093 [Flammula alnicola]|nr:hypothetical protein BDZ97DRAFT_1905093 [Flammula alnicola]